MGIPAEGFGHFFVSVAFRCFSRQKVGRCEISKDVLTVSGNSLDSLRRLSWQFQNIALSGPDTEKDNCPDCKRKKRLGKTTKPFPQTVSYWKNECPFSENELLFFGNGRSNYKNVCPFFRLKHLKGGWSNKRTKSFSRNVHPKGVCGEAEESEGFFNPNLRYLTVHMSFNISNVWTYMLLIYRLGHY